ncbi:hypothetical protein [Arcticibacter sp. MXS-1]|uniref:hypothetical protein n=1 Tax=Arcticibacter sp. MXS-1 TaxID=3341726 RepID=UPI0035A8AA21
MQVHVCTAPGNLADKLRGRDGREHLTPVYQLFFYLIRIASSFLTEIHKKGLRGRGETAFNRLRQGWKKMSDSRVVHEEQKRRTQYERKNEGGAKAVGG